MTRARTAALLVVAIALLVAPQTASAGQSPLLFRLSQANGVFGAEWNLQPGTSAWKLEVSSDTTEDQNGYWLNGFTVDLEPAQTSATVDVPAGLNYARVITTSTLDVCNVDQTDPLCIPEFSNVESITMVSRVVTLARLTGVSQAGGVISANWDLPASTDAFEVQVSTSALVRPSGFFKDEILFSVVPRRATSFTFDPLDALPLGVYYVHILTTPTYDICALNADDQACIFDYSNTLPITVVPPGSTPPPPPASLAAAADKVVSLGAIAAKSTQDVDKLSITLNAGEAVKVKLSGSVNVPGASKVYRFKPVNKSVGAGKTKLSLKLAGKAKKAVKGALKRRKRLKAKLTLVVTDNAGNAQTKKYSVRLKP